MSPVEPIEETRDEFIVECDNCGETKTYYAPRGNHLSRQLREDGWQTSCIGGEAFYFCPDCAE